jgi:hypothetical protein
MILNIRAKPYKWTIFVQNPNLAPIFHRTSLRGFSRFFKAFYRSIQQIETRTDRRSGFFDPIQLLLAYTGRLPTSKVRAIK